MSYNIENLSFTIFGSGHDSTRNDSGDGEKLKGIWYDKDGNIYTLPFMKVSAPVAPNFEWVSNGNIATCEYGITADANDTLVNVNYNVYSNDYGAGYYNALKSKGYLLYDIQENGNFLTPINLQGFSARNLIDLGLLQYGVSSVNLYKDHPLSDTYVKVEITSTLPDYIRPANAPYNDINVGTLVVKYTFYEGNQTPIIMQYGVRELDVALGEITKYDGTKGLGFVLKRVYRIPATGTATWLHAYQRIEFPSLVFGKLNIYEA